MNAPFPLLPPSVDDPVAEWSDCAALGQGDLDGFQNAGIQPHALIQGPYGLGASVVRDRITTSPRRFEFARYARPEHATEPAYIVLAFDRDGDPVDLVAWHQGFIGSWLGGVGLLGEEQLDGPRFGAPLIVHPDPLAWLRAGREGVVIVDPVRAASMLRDAGPLEVASFGERKSLLDLMRVKLPEVVVRQAGKAVPA